VKDRYGHVRAQQIGRTLATIKLLSMPDGGVSMEILPPGNEDTNFRPRHLMERVSRYIEMKPGQSGNAIRRAVSGKTDAKSLALALLVQSGYVRTEPGPHKGQLHFSEKPFREDAAA
jgi:hypothetical protein